MRSNWWAEALGPLLIGLTEGAWITVLYLLIEAMGLSPAPLGLPLFAVVVFGGALAGSRLERLGEARWRMIGLVALGIGAIGMLLGPGVLEALARGQAGAAFGAHPGGWLLGVAAFRGMLGGGTLDDPDRATRPFVRGVVGLAVTWLYAGLLPGAGQLAFRSAATLPTLLFVTSGIAAAGLRRVETISIAAGIPWWRNRPWLLGMAGLLAGAALLAVPLADGLATTEPAIIGLAGFPELVFFVVFVVLLLAPGRGPRRPTLLTARGAIVLTILFAGIAILYSVLHSQSGSGTAAAGGRGAGGSTETNGLLGAVIVVAVLLGIGLVAILLARNWRRGAARELAGSFVDEADTEVEAPGLGWLRRARARLFGPRPARRPVTAEAAYLATLELLEPLQSHRRLEDETPAAHARRLRRQGAGTLEVELLAADYELSRWGGRHVPERETRRAIGRWERSRRRISAWIEAERAAEAHAQAIERGAEA